MVGIILAMKVNAHVATSRAVGSEFVRRKLSGITLLIAVLFALFLGLGIWLTTISSWWWILVVVIIAWMILGIILLTIAWVAVKILRPQMSASQKRAVADFVDKIERVSESVQITPFMIFFRILKDMLFPSDEPFVRQIASDSTTLHSDYMALSKLFE